MARGWRGAPPNFTPEEMEQVEAGKRAVLDRYKNPPIEIKEPEPPPMGGTHGGPGGYYWKRGGVVRGKFAQGGPVMPRTGHGKR